MIQWVFQTDSNNVILANNFTINENIIVKAEGKNPLIIIANNITINGKLDLSGKPGGNAKT